MTEPFSWRGRSSMRVAAPAVVLLEALTIASVVAAFRLSPSLRDALLGVAGLLQVVSFLALMRAWLAAVSNQYAIEGEIVTRRMGLLSRRMEQMNVKDIRSIDLSQPLGQRLLGIGTVLLVTASEPMVLKNVVDPDGVVAAIHRLRRG